MDSHNKPFRNCYWVNLIYPPFLSRILGNKMKGKLLLTQLISNTKCILKSLMHVDSAKLFSSKQAGLR